MMFDTKSLNAAITQQIADAGLSDEHRNAFVLVGTTSGGVKGVLTTKINDIWHVEAVFSVQHDGAFEGGVQVRATWS